MSDYQVMPGLTPEEYQALRVDIAEHGVLVPVVRDQHGNLLDGHHRAQIADELGVSYRVDIVNVRDDEHARSLARIYNLTRRHLSSAQKRQLIAAELKANPDRSDRETGRLLGVDHKTVGSVRRELSGEIPHPGDAVDHAAELSRQRLAVMRVELDALDGRTDPDAAREAAQLAKEAREWQNLWGEWRLNVVRQLGQLLADPEGGGRSSGPTH